MVDLKKVLAAKLRDAPTVPVSALRGVIGSSIGATVGGVSAANAAHVAMTDHLAALEREGTATQVLQECVESLVKENEVLQARYDLLLGKYMELVDRVVGLLPPAKAHGNHESEESTCPKSELL